MFIFYNKYIYLYSACYIVTHINNRSKGSTPKQVFVGERNSLRLWALTTKTCKIFKNPLRNSLVCCFFPHDPPELNLLEGEQRHWLFKKKTKKTMIFLQICHLANNILRHMTWLAMGAADVAVLARGSGHASQLWSMNETADAKLCSNVAMWNCNHTWSLTSRFCWQQIFPNTI